MWAHPHRHTHCNCTRMHTRSTCHKIRQSLKMLFVAICAHSYVALRGPGVLDSTWACWLLYQKKVGFRKAKKSRESIPCPHRSLFMCGSFCCASAHVYQYMSGMHVCAWLHVAARAHAHTFSFSPKDSHASLPVWHRLCFRTSVREMCACARCVCMRIFPAF